MKHRAWTVIAVSELIVIASMTALFYPQWRGTKLKSGPPEGRPEQVRGITIHYFYDRGEFFPAAWLEKPIDCGGAQVDLDEAERVVPLIEQFAALYDREVFRQNLTDIYLLSELHCYDHAYGGTNSTTSVYLRVGTRAEGYTDRVLLATLHEEFSSILMRQYTFAAGLWQSLDGGDYDYPNDSVEILDETGLKDPPTEELLAHGFLTRYAASSMENDFNEYAGWMFVWPERLCDYGAEYAIVQQKAELTNAFYRSIDPEMEPWGCEWDPHPKQ